MTLLPVGLAHASALTAFAAHATLVNKLIGTSLQVLGGLLVLYSVNDNLGLFRAKSLHSTVIEWLKSFPLVRKSVVLSGTGTARAGATASFSATVSRSVSTLEERVTELERSLNDFRDQLQRDLRAIGVRIDTVREDFQQRMSEASSRVSDLSKRLEHATVGGFKFQALGVFFAIYGAVTSIFA